MCVVHMGLHWSESRLFFIEYLLGFNFCRSRINNSIETETCTSLILKYSSSYTNVLITHFPKRITSARRQAKAPSIDMCRRLLAQYAEVFLFLSGRPGCIESSFGASDRIQRGVTWRPYFVVSISSQDDDRSVFMWWSQSIPVTVIR